MVLVEWSEVAAIPTAAFPTATHSTTTLNKRWARHGRSLLVGVGLRVFLPWLFVLLGGREFVSRMSLEVVVLLDGGQVLIFLPNSAGLKLPAVTSSLRHDLVIVLGV